MFTGIIETIGRISDIERAEDSIRMHVTAPEVMEDAHHGDSIAINGVCLTVTDFDAQGFWADVMQVTLDYTALGSAEEGSRVNVERAMSHQSRFGGHVVQGHVDGTATLVNRTPSENWEVFRFTLDNPELAKYVVKKGSIAVNGTSLTVAEASELGEQQQWFEISLIPTTLEDTILGDLSIGDSVNIECDVLAKYVERLNGQR